jgi:hypothetical protein
MTKRPIPLWNRPCWLNSLLWLGVAVGGAGACTDDGLTGPIELAKTGGLDGNGDGSTPTLLVKLDGTAARYFPDGHQDTAALDPATIADLTDKVDRARFDTLDIRYGSASDEFTLRVTVTFGRGPRIVYTDEHATLPPPLASVIDTLVDIRDRPIWQ